MTSNIVPSSDIDPLLLSLGQMIGIIKVTDGVVELQPDWFSDPLTVTQQSIKKHPDDFVIAITQLLGEVGGNALGIPVTDPALLGTWYPLNFGSTESGLYLVSYPSPENNAIQVIGLGSFVQWQYPKATENETVVDQPDKEPKNVSTSNPEATEADNRIGPDAVKILAWGLLPLVELGDSEFKLALGQAGRPLTIGCSIEGKDNQPLFNGVDISLQGIKTSASIDINGPNPIDLSLVFVALKLPNASEARDISLVDLAALPDQEILSTITAIALSALAQTGLNKEQLAYVLPVLGLAKKIPGSDAEIPLLDWVAMAKAALNDGNPASPILAWFAQLLDDTDSGKAWLTALGQLIGTAAPDITGKGTRDDPLALTLASIDKVGRFQFTLGYQTDAQGTRQFYPGVVFNGWPQSLGNSDNYVLNMNAALELGQMNLDLGGKLSSQPDSLRGEAGFVFERGQSDQPLVNITTPKLIVDNVKAGVVLARGMQLQPSFELTNVTTENGKYDTLSLLNPEQIAEVGIDSLKSEIVKKLQELLGITNGDDVAFGTAIGTIIGLIPPELPDDAEWPATPPLSTDGLISSLANPIDAMTGYYRDLLSKKAGDKLAFTYIVEAFGTLLAESGGPSITVTGNGTQHSPWYVRLANRPISLLIYQQETADEKNKQLTFGFKVNPPLEFENQPTIDLDVTVEVIQLGIAHPADTRWLPKVSATMSLNEALETPSIAGAKITADGVSIDVNWGNMSDWAWNITVNKPTIIIGDERLSLDENLVFSDTTQLNQLMQQSNFATLLVRVMGMFIARTSQPSALAVNGVLGLLPNLGSVLPSELDWPNDMPVMTPQNFTNPIGDLQAQLKAITSSAVRLKAATTLIAWAITDGKSVPAVTGTGTITQPLHMPLGFVSGLDLLVFRGESDSLGLGLGRPQSINPMTDIQVDTDIQLLAAEVSLGDNAIHDTAIPSLILSVRMTSLSGKITTYQSQDIDGLVFKLTLRLSKEADHRSDSGLVVTPETFLISGEESLAMDNSAQAYFTALNQTFAYIINRLEGNDTFEDAYALFVDLGLVLEDKSGISTAGWNALFANPLNWLSHGMVSVLSNEKSRDNFFNLLQQMLGIALPQIPVQILELLSALGLVSSRALGYAPIPEALINLASDPVNTITNAFRDLIEDHRKLQTLMTAIAGSDSGTFSRFNWQIANGDQILIHTEHPIEIGSLVEISVTLSLNLSNGILNLATNIYLPQIRMSFAPEIRWRIDQTEQNSPLNVNILWGDGQTPSASELTIYPFVQEQFIQQLTILAPAQTVSSFVTMLLDQYVIKPYPFTAVLMQGLGLIVEQNDQLTLKSLLGLFDNPVEWLLSGTVFGADGTLDISKIADLLQTIPEISGNGIHVTQLPKDQTGVSVTGLPYDVTLKFEVDNTDTPNFVTSVSTTQTVANNVAEVSLDAAIRLNRTFQPGIIGAVKVEQNSTKTYVETGYDQDFMLRLGQTDGPILDLLPFAGWQTLIRAATSVAIQVLIQKLTKQIISNLKDTDAGDFVKRLEVAGGKDQLDIQTLINALSTAATPEEVLDNALNWLNERLSADGAPGTAQAITTLLDGLIPGTIQPANGLIRWAPSENIPLTLLSGRDDQGLLGFWADVNFPDTGLLNINVSRTGVGVNPAKNFAPSFSFGMDLQVPVVLQNNGPAIQMKFDASNNTFRMIFDPQQDNGNASSLQVELLPRFFKDQTISDWLLEVLKWVVPRYGSMVLLDITQVNRWLNAPIVAQEQAPTPADLLIGSGLIEKIADKYVLISLDELAQLTPPRFIGGFLTALLNNPVKVLTIGKDGGVWLEKNNELGYGIRLRANDIAVNALPYVTFQLGAEQNQWMTESGPSDYPPPQSGLAAYLPIKEAPDYTPDFAGMSLVLSNVGLDIHGKNQAPIISVSRFSMQQVRPRTRLQLTFDDSSKTVVGGSIAFENLGWALSPNRLPQNTSVNPVAANLLGSGSSSDTQNPPTDPTFSAIAAYTSPGKFWAGLQNADGDAVNEVILPIQQSFGPLNVQQVSMLWDNPTTRLGVGFTGGLDISALSMTVFDLTVGVDVSAPLSLDAYDLDLRGLAVSFESGSVSIGGGLVKEGSGQDVLYNGAINVKVGRFGITAVGSYGLMTDTVTNEQHPSFFVFAASGTPLGGPPAFFLKGFSGGFAYNRTLELPQPDKVQDFILVQAASDPDSIFGSDPTPSQALSKMSDVIRPEVGAYWVAAGVHFTSYSLIDTTALAVVEFGNTTSVSLLGVSTISQPPLVKDPSKALMFAQLGIIITVNITAGELLARAQLTPASFILAKNCKITGGFALAIWWSPNHHAGDFCLSLGGYNANYTPPSYYPVVSRLGLRWPIADASIIGEAYFALTPNAIMAGGRLELEFSAGPLSAWFKSNADFIIAWKPFYFDVDISISIGAAFTTKLLGTTITLKAELGASLHLWGPPTAGKITVNWYVISFSIPIGNQNPDLDNKPLGTWALFAENFLPPPTQPQLATGDTENITDTPQQQVLKLQIPKGLIQGKANTDIWTIKRIGFELRADSAVPGTKVSAGNLDPIVNKALLGVRPMDISTLTSEMTFTLTSEGKNYAIDSDTFDMIAYTDNSPMGLWATTQLQTKTAPATSTVIPDTMTGAAIAGVRYQYTGALGPADLAVFNSEQLKDMTLPLSVNPPYIPAEPLAQNSPIQTIMDTIMANSVVELRNGILTSLQDRALFAPLNPDLYVMSTQATNIFQAPPVLAELNQTLAPAQTKPLTRLLRKTVTPKSQPTITPPTCLGGARRYAGKLKPEGHGFMACRPTTANWIDGYNLGDHPSLRRGSVALYSVDKKVAHNLTLDGQLGVRVVGFDPRHEPVCILEQNTQQKPNIGLPAGLDHVAICGAEVNIDIAGWQRGSKLVRLNSRYLLGDDCLIKPQACLRDPSKKERDIYCAEQMLEHNQLEHSDGRHQGWVTTWLPAHHDQAGVIFKCEQHEIEFALVKRDINGKLTRRSIVPLVSNIGHGCLSAIFDITNTSVDGWVRLMVRTQKPEQLHSVISYIGDEKHALHHFIRDDTKYLGKDAHCLTKPINVKVKLTPEGEI